MSKTRIYATHDQFDSKNGEIEFLEKIRLAIPENTYLSQLINEPLIAMFAETIARDESPNITNTIDLLETANTTLESKLQTAQVEYENLSTRHAALKDNYTDVIKERDSALEQIEFLTNGKQTVSVPMYPDGMESIFANPSPFPQHVYDRDKELDPAVENTILRDIISNIQKDFDESIADEIKMLEMIDRLKKENTELKAYAFELIMLIKDEIDLE